jgi:hypothetical protein
MTLLLMEIYINGVVGRMVIKGGTVDSINLPLAGVVILEAKLDESMLVFSLSS